MHPAVEGQFEPRFRELRGPDGSYLKVKSADAGRALGLTPTLAIYDEFCVAKNEQLYTALRSALLPGATMFTVTTAGWGAEKSVGGTARPAGVLRMGPDSSFGTQEATKEKIRAESRPHGTSVRQPFTPTSG